ncbi:exported hypothetical protein [Flavobacterium psychrophilum]|nr:exported hypothetical protein [Flavobacterium psychrophilum]SNA80002.1 exported hypothetical protein [Flavobacterium psychrophilum]
MKKIIIAGVFSVFVLTATFAYANHTKNGENKSENVECKYGRCSYIKKNYEQCKNCVSNQYDSYCSSHK